MSTLCPCFARGSTLDVAHLAAAARCQRPRCARAAAPSPPPPRPGPPACYLRRRPASGRPGCARAGSRRSRRGPRGPPGSTASRRGGSAGSALQTWALPRREPAPWPSCRAPPPSGWAGCRGRPGRWREVSKGRSQGASISGAGERARRGSIAVRRTWQTRRCAGGGAPCPAGHCTPRPPAASCLERSRHVEGEEDGS